MITVGPLIGMVAWIFWKLCALLMGVFHKAEAKEWFQSRARWALVRAEWWDNGGMQYPWKAWQKLEELKQSSRSSIGRKVLENLWCQRSCAVDLAKRLKLGFEEIREALLQLQEAGLVTVVPEQQEHLAELPDHLVLFKLI